MITPLNLAQHGATFMAAFPSVDLGHFKCILQTLILWAVTFRMPLFTAGRTSLLEALCTFGMIATTNS